MPAAAAIQLQLQIDVLAFRSVSIRKYDIFVKSDGLFVYATFNSLVR